MAQALVQEAVDFAETLTESDFGCSSELDYRPIETMKPAGFGTPSSTSSRGEATRLRCCLVAGVSLLLAVVVRFCLTPVLGEEELPFALFIVAALVTSWYGGALIGTATLFLGLVIGDYLFLSPKWSLGLISRADVILFARAVLTGSVGIFLIENLRRGQRRAEVAARELEGEVDRRRQSEAALLEAQTKLSRYAQDLEARVLERTANLSAAIDSLRELLYHIAHNLRGPARALRGYASAMIEDGGPQLQPKIRDYAGRIADAAGRMESVIQAVLDYGRLAHLDVGLTDVSLEQAVEQAREQLGGSIKMSGAEITVTGPLPHVRADPELLVRVLVQLMDNAIRFVADGVQPRVTIWADSNESTVRLWVQDNGIGIEPQYQDRIFRPFERLHSPQAYGGAGIGLAIVKHAMERMQGKAGLTSGPGSGSRFWIELSRASLATPSTS